MLTNPEIASMQSTVNSSLVETCTINRPGTATINDYGEPIPGSGTSTSEPCKLQYLGGGGEAVRAQRLSNNTPWIVVMRHDADVRVTDTITVKGKTLEVKEVIDDMTNQLSVRAVCSEIR